MQFVVHPEGTVRIQILLAHHSSQMQPWKMAMLRMGEKAIDSWAAGHYCAAAAREGLRLVFVFLVPFWTACACVHVC